MRYRAPAGVALALCLAAATQTSLAAPANKTMSQNGHAHHLLKAEQDLVAAEASIVSQNLTQAQKHVAAAMRQIQEAIAHHHKHHIASASGLSGAARKAHHHKHHATLQQAERELAAAGKALQSGNGQLASKEIAHAAKTVQAAVTSHHHLFGKQ